MLCVGAISPKIVVSGLKVSFLSVAFGVLVFLVARMAIIILIWIQKDQKIRITKK